MTKNDYVFRYRVRNWHDYNRALVSRGRLTFWFDEAAIAGWRNTELRSGAGTPRIYSDTAIQCALVLKSVFHLSLRATQGFLGSVVELMKLDLPVPDYSTVSRRQGSLAVSLPLVNESDTSLLMRPGSRFTEQGSGTFKSTGPVGAEPGVSCIWVSTIQRRRLWPRKLRQVAFTRV
jgi:hypothetical protein